MIHEFANLIPNQKIMQIRMFKIVLHLYIFMALGVVQLTNRQWILSKDMSDRTTRSAYIA
jgi:hypothetical protein